MYDEYEQLVLNKIIPWWKKQVQEHWTDMSQDMSLKIYFKIYDGIEFYLFGNRCCCKYLQPPIESEPLRQSFDAIHVLKNVLSILDFCVVYVKIIRCK